MTYSYLRVSTDRQSIDRQRMNIIKAGYTETREYTDSVTGATMDRSGWKNLMRVVKAGDTIVFDSVSRMSRDSDEGVKAYMELFNMGVSLVFLNEPHLNTDVFRESQSQAVKLVGGDVDFILEGINKYLSALARKQIEIGFQQAEKERKDISSRVKAGMEAAKLKAEDEGQIKVYGNRKEKLVTKKSITSKELIRAMSKRFDGTHTDKDIMENHLHINRNTYYKYIREMIAEEKPDKT